MKSENVLSAQRKNYQNGVPGLFLEFLIMLTVSLILVSLVYIDLARAKSEAPIN